MSSLQDNFNQQLSDTELDNFSIRDKLSGTICPSVKFEIEDEVEHRVKTQVENGYISCSHIVSNSDDSITVAHRFFGNASEAVDWIVQIDNSFNESR